ncbi:fasciclin domain-containing protein [Leptolyngbya ohadii]|uniref:fasciclin domain-containing protein n=1 Tax=Leptolyngbya ohadii TaxID=1962290 RepID=UPI0019D4CDF4|nr:fasciclin domain-containing protein [Leptolyngbya ohadii]
MSFKSQLRFLTVAAVGLMGAVALNPAQAQTTSSPTSPTQPTTQPGLTTPGTSGTTTQPGLTTPGTPGTTQPGLGTTPGTSGTTTQPGLGTGTSTPGSTNTPGVTAPTTRPAPANQANTGNTGIAELLRQASSAGTFNTLARAVQAAGVANAIPATGDQQFTIFAPTDEAFAALPPGTLEKLLQPENQALLRQVLAYHVVPGEVTSSQLRTGVVDTLGGGVAVRVADGRVILNDASVVQPDIQAANGVIHVVNRVLLPAELRRQLISLQ